MQTIQSLQKVKSLIDSTLTISIKDAYLYNIDLILELDPTTPNRSKFNELKSLINKECNYHKWQENTPSWYCRRLFKGEDYFDLSLTEIYGIVYDDVLRKIMDIMADIILEANEPKENKLNEIIKAIWNSIGPDVKEYWITAEYDKQNIDNLIDELIGELNG